MTLIIRITSCLLALMTAIALFVVALFRQSGIDAVSGSPIVLFGLSIALFMVANYYGFLIRDRRIELEGQRQRRRTRIR